MPSGLWLMFVLAVLGCTGCDRESTPARQNHPNSAPSVASFAPNNIEARVLKIMGEQFGVNILELKPGVHLAKDLKADDLDTVELVMEIEDSFEISIPDEDFDRLKTVGDWTGYVRSRVKQTAPGK